MYNYIDVYTARVSMIIYIYMKHLEFSPMLLKMDYRRQRQSTTLHTSSGPLRDQKMPLSIYLFQV